MTSLDSSPGPEGFFGKSGLTATPLKTFFSDGGSGGGRTTKNTLIAREGRESGGMSICGRGGCGATDMVFIVGAARLSYPNLLSIDTDSFQS